ncbi:MAG TPA: transcription elongation factor GreA [Dehalococcoidia bacterium]|nr:transcription elongation factor GreA [Dehalococcoidia bacterium]
MTEKPTPLTREGLAKFQEKLDHLVHVRRPEVAHRIQEARELAGSQNTAEYEDAKNEQALVEGEILQLEALIQNAVIIEEAHDGKMVELGVKVTIVNDKKEKKQYTLVGSAEADPKAGRISNESPVGKALMGKRVGEEVAIEAPAGVVHWTIKDIN